MKSKHLFFPITLLTVLALAACGPAPQLPDEVSVDQDIPELFLPDCPNNYFFAPEVVYPFEGSRVLDLQPEFEWTFPLDCLPLGFYLRVGTTDDPQSDDLLNGGAGNLQSQGRTYQGVELLPATWHRWRVYAQLTQGTAIGGGEFVNFVTGPTCDPGELLAPILYMPGNGATDGGKGFGNFEEVILTVDYPAQGCIPEYFEMYVSLFEDFSELSYAVKFGYFGLHYPGYTNPDGLLLAQTESDALENCTMYYWRSRAIVGDSEGPLSDTHNFYTDFFGDCLVLDLDEFEFGDFPYIMAPQNVNCRASDDSASRNLGTLFEGEQVMVLAVNPEATHVMIMEPSFDVSCWVWLGVVDLMQGDMPFDPDQLLELVPLQNPIVLPTSTPTFPPPPPSNTPVPPQCSDGIENDGDGAIDYGDLAAIAAGTADRECSSPDDDDETN